MNVQMWVKALRIIPRLTGEEWKKLDVISRWLVSTRAAVLVMTFFSAAIAGLLTALAGDFVLWKWLLLTIGLVFAHATNNLLNDYTDFKRGVDKDNYFRTQYGPQPLQSGLMSERELLTYAAITGLIALAAGLPLVILNGWIAWALLAAGIVFVLFYTWPLKYIGLGEIAVILIWGPLMVAGGYFVITGQWNWNVAIASLPYALGPTSVLFGKHIDKLDQDKAKGIHTLPVILGEKAARYAVLVDDCPDVPAGGLPDPDWLFQPGDDDCAGRPDCPAWPLENVPGSQAKGRTGGPAQRYLAAVLLRCQLWPQPALRHLFPAWFDLGIGVTSYSQIIL